MERPKDCRLLQHGTIGNVRGKESTTKNMQDKQQTDKTVRPMAKHITRSQFNQQHDHRGKKRHRKPLQKTEMWSSAVVPPSNGGHQLHTFLERHTKMRTWRKSQAISAKKQSEKGWHRSSAVSWHHSLNPGTEGFDSKGIQKIPQSQER